MAATPPTSRKQHSFSQSHSGMTSSQQTLSRRRHHNKSSFKQKRRPVPRRLAATITPQPFSLPALCEGTRSAAHPRRISNCSAEILTRSTNVRGSAASGMAGSATGKGMRRKATRYVIDQGISRVFVVYFFFGVCKVM